MRQCGDGQNLPRFVLTGLSLSSILGRIWCNAICRPENAVSSALAETPGWTHRLWVRRLNRLAYLGNTTVLHSDQRQLLLALLGVFLINSAWSQALPQDGIDRNLQQREARQREFHASLEDRRGAPPALSGGGFEAKWNFLMLPAGSEPPLRLPQGVTPTPSTARVPSETSVVNGEVQLQDSQQRRQLELQLQTGAGTQVPGVPDPGRQQSLQTQQLGFEREIRAQDLQSNILRDSARAMGNKP
jgi:hypothetical protein